MGIVVPGEGMAVSDGAELVSELGAVVVVLEWVVEEWVSVELDELPEALMPLNSSRDK